MIIFIVFSKSFDLEVNGYGGGGGMQVVPKHISSLILKTL